MSYEVKPEKIASLHRQVPSDLFVYIDWRLCVYMWALFWSRTPQWRILTLPTMYRVDGSLTKPNSGTVIRIRASYFSQPITEGSGSNRFATRLCGQRFFTARCIVCINEWSRRAASGGRGRLLRKWFNWIQNDANSVWTRVRTICKLSSPFLNNVPYSSIQRNLVLNSLRWVAVV